MTISIQLASYTHYMYYACFNTSDQIWPTSMIIITTLDREELLILASNYYYGMSIDIAKNVQLMLLALYPGLPMFFNAHEKNRKAWSIWRYNWMRLRISATRPQSWSRGES